jgi:[acyl-carrier-protein] S-malonyltransferase
LLKTRGLAMQEAVPVGEGAMAAILGVEFDTLVDIAGAASLDQVCDIANDNAPGQVVISGDKAAVERAIDLAKARGAKRALQLPVSAPFHSRLMAPAAEVMHEALAAVAMHAPVVPLVANVLARPISDPDEIRKRLVEQVTSMVRWTDSVRWLVTEGEVTELAELGVGKVLTGLARRISPETAALALGTPADIEAYAAALGA